MTLDTYEFDTSETKGTRFLDENNDTVAWLLAEVFPPVGTEVQLPDGALAQVTNLALDLSNPSGIAQIFVSVKRIG